MNEPTVLELYETRHELQPLTPDEILRQVDAAEGILKDDAPPQDLIDERLICWLNDRVQALAGRLAMNKAPEAYRCGWCFRAAGAKDEDWNELPEMSLEEVGVHTLSCEHNPLVKQSRELAAQLEDLQGRKLGNADTWAEVASEATGMYDHMHDLHESMKATIRTLLITELPAGELRRAIGELVK